MVAILSPGLHPGLQEGYPSGVGGMVEKWMRCVGCLYPERRNIKPEIVCDIETQQLNLIQNKNPRLDEKAGREFSMTLMVVVVNYSENLLNFSSTFEGFALL